MKNSFIQKKRRLPISVSVVIPIYNNQHTAIPLILKSESILKKLCKRFEIILSDDRSIDQTVSLLNKNLGKKKNIKIIRNKKNLGIAKNIMNLYKKALYEYTVLFSVDGDWNPSDIKKLIESIYYNKSDVVIGKRNRKVYSIYRRLISFFYNFLPKIVFGVDTVDAGSIKIFKSQVFKKIPLQSKSVFFEAEFIIRSARLGHTVTSVPVSFQRLNKKTGKGGKIKLIFSSIIDFVRLLLVL